MFHNFEDNFKYTINEASDIEQILRIIMTKEYSLKEVLKPFGETGEHAVSSQLTQMHNMETVTPLDDSKLSRGIRSENYHP